MMGAVVHRVRAQEQGSAELPPGTIRVPLRAAEAALAVTIMGATATACLMFLEAVGLPPVAHDAPALLGDLLNLDGPLLGSPLLLALSALAAVLPVGFVALGVVAERRDIHARAGAMAVGVVLSWWGWLLWAAGRNAISAEGPATT